MAALPFRLAVQSGVAPRSFAAFTLAPARISRSALSTIVAVARPMERGRAVGLGRVDVRFLVEQRAHRDLVSVPGRIDQWKIGAIGPRSDIGCDRDSDNSRLRPCRAEDEQIRGEASA